MGERVIPTYTAFALTTLVGVILLDNGLNTHVFRVRNHPFWAAAIAFVAFQLVFDNFFTARGLWLFDPTSLLGIFLPFIPIENLLFGFCLFSCTIILYEHFCRARPN